MAIGRGKNGAGEQGGGTTCAVTWGAGGSSTANNTIIVVIFDTNQFARTYTIADDASGGTNTYTLDADFLGYNNIRCYVYSCLVAKAVSTITVTASGYEIFSVSTMEYSGIATSAAFDKESTFHDNDYTTSVTTWTSDATGTLSQADEIVIGVIQDVYGRILTVSATGYTAYTLVSMGGVVDKIVSSTDSVTPSGDSTKVAGDYRLYAAAVTYKAVATAGETFLTGVHFYDF
jgi:hypothetical protein